MQRSHARSPRPVTSSRAEGSGSFGAQGAPSEDFANDCGYRSSAGEDLAPHTKPVHAAEQITRILTPYVAAVLAAKTHRRETTGEQRPLPRPHPDQPHAKTIADLQDRSGVICWWGSHTEEWWALVPGGTQWQIVSAPDPESLIETIANARARR